MRCTFLNGTVHAMRDVLVMRVMYAIHTMHATYAMNKMHAMHAMHAMHQGISVETMHVHAIIRRMFHQFASRLPTQIQFSRTI